MVRRPLAFLPLLLIVSCKDTGQNFEEEGTVPAKRHAEFYAADSEYLQKNSNFYFRVWNDGFTRRLEDLPASGQVTAERMPHSGSYYAEQDGGTDQVVAGNKSALAKYDDAFHGGEPKAVTWEREKHTNGPSWAGHCNGFGATTQRHPKEPVKSVVRGGVTFDPRDIKALLAEIHMNADYEFLGGNRCEIDINALPTPGTRADPKVMGDCEDINPGTLHAAMTNWIGRMHHALIMDMYSGEQVWNYALYKYDVTTKQELTQAQASELVGGGSTYKWNPTAVKFFRLESKLTYAEATRKESLGKLTPAEMTLNYVLELNAEGEIVGGEWADANSRKNHPDFLWVALAPLEPNGTRYMGNQHLDNKEVIKMWAESIGADPDNPPLDIVRPAGKDDWGHYASFDVLLDGNNHGAVFAGKPAVLSIKRKEGLTGAGVVLEAALNGSPLKTVTTTGNEDIKVAFDPGLGLSRVQLTFKRDGAVVDDQYLRFHVMR